MIQHVIMVQVQTLMMEVVIFNVMDVLILVQQIMIQMQRLMMEVVFMKSLILQKI